MAGFPQKGNSPVSLRRIALLYCPQHTQSSTITVLPGVVSDAPPSLLPTSVDPQCCCILHLELSGELAPPVLGKSR